jgi:colicin import membrane protein
LNESNPVEIEEPESAIDEYRPIEAGLALLRQKYEGAVFDIGSAKGLDDARKARAEIREPRYECEKIRKRLKAPALEYSRRIDTEAARITAELEKIEAPIDFVIKREEQAIEARREEKRKAEMERLARLNEMVAEVRGWPLLAVELSAQEMRALCARCEGISLDTFPQEIRDEIGQAKDDACRKLREMLAAQEAWEQEEEERREQADRQREEQAKWREQQAAEARRLREERERWAKEQAAERAELDRQHAEHARIEREIATERARGLAPRPPPDTWPSDPSEPTAQQAGHGTQMRVRFEKRGGHYHCRVFTAPRPGVAFAKNGDLVFDEAEWPDIRLLMRGAEFVEEAWP